jgi:hypothetical protein
MTRPSRRFTRGDDFELRRLAASGAAVSQIAEALGRAASSIKSRARNIGVTSIAADPCRFTPAEDSALRELAASGTALRQIAEKLGRPPTSVKARARKIGAAIAARPCKPSKWSDQDCLFLDDAAHKWGWSLAAAAAMLGRSKKTVKQKCFVRGISFLNRNPRIVTFSFPRTFLPELQELATAYGMSVPGFCRAVVQTTITEQLVFAVLGFAPREEEPKG